MRKLFLFAVFMVCFFPASQIFAQQQESWTFFCSGNYGYLVDTAATSSSSYFQRYNFGGTTGYQAHMQNDTIYQGYGSGANTGGYASVKKWAVTGSNTATCVWTYTASNMHHDLCPMPNGNVLVLVRETKTAAEVTAAGGSQNISISSDIIEEIHPTGTTTGTIVWQWKLWDHLCQNTSSSKPNYVTSIAANPQRWNINCNLQSDGFHPNGIDYNADLDQIVFSSHNNSELFIIDHSTTMAEAATSSGGKSGKGGDFLYRWGNPANYGLSASGNGITLHTIHDVRWVPYTNKKYPGYISFFHNNTNYGNAQVVVFLPNHSTTNKYLYDYTAGSVIPPTTCTTPTVYSFTVQNMGGAMVCENGNPIICNPGSKFYECSGTGTTYQSCSIGTPQADRMKKSEVIGPWIKASTTDTLICINNPASLNCSNPVASKMVTSPAYSYSWSSNPVGFTSTLQNPTVTPPTTGTFIYTVSVTMTGSVSTTAYTSTNTSSVTVVVDACTGVEDNTIKEPELKIFPNPADGVVYLNDEFLRSTDFEISVYNAYGEMILQDQNIRSIDLSKCKNGIYYLSLKTNDQKIITKKIVLIQ
jgi:hypothetical protein